MNCNSGKCVRSEKACQTPDSDVPIQASQEPNTVLNKTRTAILTRMVYGLMVNQIRYCLSLITVS